MCETIRPAQARLLLLFTSARLHRTAPMRLLATVSASTKPVHNYSTSITESIIITTMILLALPSLLLLPQ
jgi:hypothetical protein